MSTSEGHCTRYDMDDAECDRQFALWKDHAANHMLQAAHALMETIRYAEEDEEIILLV